MTIQYMDDEIASDFTRIFYTSPGCSSEVGRAVAPDHDIDVGAVARDRLAGVSAGSTVTPNAHLRQMSIHSFATAAGGVPCVQVVGSIVTPPLPGESAPTEAS